MSTESKILQNTKVPISHKIAFGIGMFANQMFPAILGIFMVVLVKDLGFSGAQWGLLFFLPRVFDSVTDPIMGYISDNTKSKWGRRRQYVFVGGLIMGVAFIFMWQLFKEHTVDYNFWYFLIWSFVFYLGLTIFSVPYVAMGYEMTEDFHERTNIMAVAQWIGQWAWVIAPWFWVIMYDQEWFPSAEVATRQLAYWVAIPCAICAMIPALFIPSRSTVHEDYSPLTMANIGSSLTSIFKGFKDAFNIKPFRQLCTSTFLIFNAFNTVAALTFFVIVYKLFNGDAGASGVWVTLFGCLGALGTTFIVIPIVTYLSKRFGKRNAFYLCCVPGKPWLYIIGLPFFSFGIGSLFTLMMSMTADVIDIDELNSGLRREGIFGAIYWWMVKFGFAIAGGLSGWIIDFVGFNPELATIDQQSAVDGLHAFFCFFPAVGTLLAIAIMSRYEVSEEKSHEIRAQIKARKHGYHQAYSAVNLGAEIVIETEKYQNADIQHLQTHELVPIFTKQLEAGLHGLCFNPYLASQTTKDALSEEQIRRRVNIIRPYTQWIRSFLCTG